MERSESTAATYELARPPYGLPFFAEVAEAIGLDRSQRLLDVGTGPGILAIGFAPYCRSVTGVEPEPAMVDAARAAAIRGGVSLHVTAGRLEDLPDSPGAFDVVTIGRAIQWLDPKAVYQKLDRIVAAGGRIVVCHADSVIDGRNPWLETFIGVLRRFGGERASCDERSFFDGSRFQRRRTITVETTYLVPILRFARELLSLSASPAGPGDRISEMREAMREAMAHFATEGVIDDIVAARADVFEG